jgi:replicative DNA helicase
MGHKGSGDPIPVPPIPPSRFSIERHRYIWDAILEQNRKKLPIDHNTIIGVLRERGTLASAGGVPYVGSLDEPGTEENLTYYATRLTSAAARRCLGPLGKQISELALRDDTEGRATVPARFRVLANRAERMAELSMRNGHHQTLKTKSLYQFASEPADPIKWVYEPWLCPGDMVILAGEPGLGKSWIALDLMFSLARGADFMGLANQAGPASVLYIDEENNERIVRYRVSKLTLGHDLGFQDLDPANVNATYAYENDFNFDDPANVQRLETLARDINPDWLVFDSLIRIHQRDENSNSEMSSLIQGTIGALARRIGCGVVVVHHLSKATKDRPSSRIADRLRGASAIRGSADQIWGLERVDDDLRISHIKGRMTEATPRLLTLEDVMSGMGVVVTARDAERGGEELILDRLGTAGADGSSRKTIIEDLEEEGFKSASRIVSSLLGRMYREGKVRKLRERAGTRYWIAEAAPKEAE